jgi:hypothetical protein
VENPTRQLREASLLQSFRKIGDFPDLLRQNPSSLFILLGFSSISIASLVVRSVYLGLVGGNVGTMQLDAVSEADDVLNPTYGRKVTESSLSLGRATLMVGVTAL